MATISDFDSVQDVLKKVIELIATLNEEQRKFVLLSASAWFKDSGNLTTSLLKEQGTESNENPPSLQDFVFSKKTKNDAEAVTVLAYYLTMYRKQELFKTADLEGLNREAATGQIFGKITKTVNNAARRSGFFASIGEKGFKKITPLGKMVVEALPDEEKVKKLIKDHQPRPKKRKATKKEGEHAK